MLPSGDTLVPGRQQLGTIDKLQTALILMSMRLSFLYKVIASLSWVLDNCVRLVAGFLFISTLLLICSHLPDRYCSS